MCEDYPCCGHEESCDTDTGLTEEEFRMLLWLREEQ